MSLSTMPEMIHPYPKRQDEGHVERAQSGTVPAYLKGTS